MPKVVVHLRRSNFDSLVKSLQGRHSREACPRPDRGAGVHKHLIFLDSRFHGNDNNGCFLTFYETINFNKAKFVSGKSCDDAWSVSVLLTKIIEL